MVCTEERFNQFDRRQVFLHDRVDLIKPLLHRPKQRAASFSTHSKNKSKIGTVIRRKNPSFALTVSERIMPPQSLTAPGA